jgi:transcriptional regulator with XRE-family HTH domain
LEIVPKVSTREQIITLTVTVLRQRRVRAGMSMNRLAEKSGLSLTMISFVERGLRGPTLDTLLRIAGALEVELWQVLRQAARQCGKTYGNSKR